MNKQIRIIVLLAAVVAALAGWWVTQDDLSSSSSPKPDDSQEVLYWYDPMRPDQHFDAPGKSPFMDMQLVPKYAEAANPQGSGAFTVQIDPRMSQNLGMRTARVRSGTFWKTVEAVGSVAVDEHRIVSVTARAAGWIERLDVRAVGDRVRAGQVVAGLYSPELLAARQELELARKLDDKTLISAAQARLKLLQANTDGPVQRQTLIVAPASGVVTELMVRQGAEVTPGMPLMKLADLEKVWIIVEVPEVQAAWIAPDNPAKARFQSLPGQMFEGTVEYIYPLLDPATRTVRARLAFANITGDLKPGMFAEVTVYGGKQENVTLVPSEAVVRTGTRTVVLVAEGDGRYRPVSVIIGAEQNNQTVIVRGLEPGQQVVVSGQFLIDSEASLQGAYQRMEASEPFASTTASTPEETNSDRNAHTSLGSSSTMPVDGEER